MEGGWEGGTGKGERDMYMMTTISTFSYLGTITGKIPFEGGNRATMELDLGKVSA